MKKIDEVQKMEILRKIIDNFPFDSLTREQANRLINNHNWIKRFIDEVQNKSRVFPIETPYLEMKRSFQLPSFKKEEHIYRMPHLFNDIEFKKKRTAKVIVHMYDIKDTRISYMDALSSFGKDINLLSVETAAQIQYIFNLYQSFMEENRIPFSLLCENKKKKEKVIFHLYYDRGNYFLSQRRLEDKIVFYEYNKPYLLVVENLKK